MAWAMAAIWLAATVLYEVVRPKAKFENAQPAQHGDFKMPTAAEKRPVPVIWGKCWIEGPNVIWWGNLSEHAVNKRVRTGWFSSTSYISHYNYQATIQWAVCRGPGVHLHSVFSNKVGISFRHGTTFDNGDRVGDLGRRAFADSDANDDWGGLGGRFWWSAGNYEASDPNHGWTWLNAKANYHVPEYRGTAYFLFMGGYQASGVSGNTGFIGPSTVLPPLMFVVSRWPDPLGLVDLGHQGDKEKLNPMSALYELLTDTYFGMGVPDSEIDVSNFREAAATLWDEANTYARAVDSDVEVYEIIREIERQIDGVLMYDQEEEKWRVKLLRDDYDAETLPEYDESSVEELVEYSRQSWQDTVNEVRISFTYEHAGVLLPITTYALAQDQANRRIQGRVVSSEMNFPGVDDRVFARTLAARELQQQGYPLSKITLRMNRKGFDRRPGDVFKFSWSRLGIESAIYRIGTIDYGRIGEPTITVRAIEDIFAVGLGGFGVPPESDWDGTGAPALQIWDYIVMETPRQLGGFNPEQWSSNDRILMLAVKPSSGSTAIRPSFRHGMTRPLSGDFTDEDTFFSWCPVGELTTALNAVNTFTRPDTTVDLLASTVDGGAWAGKELVGNNSPLEESLNNGSRVLLVVSGGKHELIGFEEMVQDTETTWKAKRLYRGMFHTAPIAHPVGAKIYPMVWSSLSEASYPYNHVDVRLDTIQGNGFEVDGIPNELDLTHRWAQPLPSRDLRSVGAGVPPTSYNMDTICALGRTGNDNRAVEITHTPRNWRVDDVLYDHIVDHGGAPAPVNPRYLYSIVGLIPEVESVDVVYHFPRNVILKALGTGPIPTDPVTVSVRSRHAWPWWTPVVTRTADIPLEYGAPLATGLTGLRFGVVGTAGSAAVAFGETGTYTFAISSSLPGGSELEAKINAGTWETVISVGNTSGTLDVTGDDVIELRLTAGLSNLYFFSLTGPVAEVGYGVLE